MRSDSPPPKDPRFPGRGLLGRLFPPRNRRRSSKPTKIRRAAALVFALLFVIAGWATSGAWLGEVFKATGSPLPVVSPPSFRMEAAWIEDPPRSEPRFSIARQRASTIDPSAPPRLVEWLAPLASGAFRRTGSEPENSDAAGVLRVEYSLGETLTEEIFHILESGRVERGLAIVLDPRSGRLLAYVSTDPEALSPDGTYPAASIVKLLTAATLLEEAPVEAEQACLYRGNKYRLSRSRLVRPKSGFRTTLARALASSNNQCFAQWAVHVLGEQKLRSAFQNFGWLDSPAPGHEPGRLGEIETKLDLGRLGSGLDGIRVNPLHVASLATILTDGRWIEPWWIDRVVDAAGQSVALPPRAASRRVLSPAVADRVRSMMVGTTTMGTAKSAFRTRRGRRLLGDVVVAGKTGNVTGSDPYGRYEWFLGLAPAAAPTIAVVVLQVQNNLWWSRSSELAVEVLRTVFCDPAGCRSQLADRFTGDLSGWTVPRLNSQLARSVLVSSVE